MSPVTVTPDTTTLVYTGPTTAVNGQPVTLTGTLTTDNPSAGTPLNGQLVTINLGTQSCNGTTQPDGTVSCTIPTVAQTMSNVNVTATYGGSFSQSPASLPTPVPAVVKEPTSLTVQGGPADYGDATTVSGTLTDTLTTAPIVGEQLTLSLNGTDTCTTTVPTDATGTASCTITPSEKAGTYPLTGTFGGDSGQPLELMASNASSNFVVTLEETTLTYTGPTVAQNGQPLTLSGVLTTESTAPDTDGDSGLAAPIAGRTVAFQLGSGGSAQTCSGVTDPTGTAQMHDHLGQPATGADPGDRHLHERLVLPDGERRFDGEPARGDEVDGQPDLGRLQRIDPGLGDIDQHLHGPARPR